MKEKVPHVVADLDVLVALARSGPHLEGIVKVTVGEHR